MSMIREYFNGVCDLIASQYKIAGAVTHKPDIGANRERIVVEFLDKHLPKRLRATIGGQVIGADGSASGQIDILVSSDISVRFDQNEKTFVSAESLAGAISVKSKLDKSSLEDCLRNLADIPQIDRNVLSMHRVSRAKYERFILTHPALYVFAYEGMSINTCLAQIKDFYDRHPDIPKNRYVAGVIVNGKYIIQYWHDELTFIDGTKRPPGTYYDVLLDTSNRGLPFCFLLNNYVGYVSWLAEIDVSMEQYFSPLLRSA